jgi:hypothetical protein
VNTPLSLSSAVAILSFAPFPDDIYEGIQFSLCVRLGIGERGEPFFILDLRVKQGVDLLSRLLPLTQAQADRQLEDSFQPIHAGLRLLLTDREMSQMIGHHVELAVDFFVYHFLPPFFAEFFVAPSGFACVFGAPQTSCV